MTKTLRIWVLAALGLSLMWGAGPAGAAADRIINENLRLRRNLTLGPTNAAATITLTGSSGNGSFAGNLTVTGTVTATGGVVGGTSNGTFADGDATTPGLRFTQDPNNGLYRIGADNLGLSIGGTKRWDFSTTTSALTGILTVSGATTITGLLSGDGGFALDTTLFTIADTTGVLSSVPTTTTAVAWRLNAKTLTSGQGFIIEVDDDVLNGGYPFEVEGGSAHDTDQFHIAEGGVVYTLGKVTATGGLDTGTGYSGTGATITNAGVAQFDGAVTCASTLAVTGAQTNSGLTNLNGGLAMETTVLTIEDETGAISSIPTTTTGAATWFDYKTLTSGTGLALEVDDDVLDGGYPFIVYGGAAHDTDQFHIAEGGVVYGLGAASFGGLITGSLGATVTGVLTSKYDAAAYWTATTANAGATTFDQVSDGTAGFIFTDPVTFCPTGGTAVVSAGVLGGAGTGTGASAATIASGAAKGLSFYTKSTSTTASHTVTGLYWNNDYGTSGSSAAPSGDVIRGRAYLVGDASGGSALTGGAFSVELAATTASNTGLTAGLRGNLVLPSGVLTNSGTYYGTMAEVFLGGAAVDTTAYTRIAPLGLVVGGTAPTAASQVANMDAIAIDVPANMVTSDGTMIVTGGAADTCDAKMKISINGTNYWIMLSTDDE